MININEGYFDRFRLEFSTYLFRIKVETPNFILKTFDKLQCSTVKEHHYDDNVDIGIND